jgi:hypothetical protein
MLKAAIALLVAGVIAFAVYSFTARPDYDLDYQVSESALQAKVQSAEIYPKAAFTNNALQIRMANAVKEEYLYITVRWKKNGEEIHGFAEPTLPPNKFKKDDTITAEVNLLGPEAMAEPVVTSPVHILNTRPDIVEASAMLQTVPSDHIRVRVNATDADGDRLRYTYRWFRNGAEIPGETKSTLDVSKCGQGDEVFAEVVAMDGTDQSPATRSEAIKIGSNAPKITSNPPGSFTKDRRYVYQLTVDSPDPEGLVFNLVKSPEGMKINDTGLIDWPLPDAQVGSREYEVTVRVTDRTGGEAFQEFKIALSAEAKR